MREITLGENPNVTIPLLGFMGVPSAIDITRVGSSGILPVINTAIAHKDAGVGMIGAGIVHPPLRLLRESHSWLVRTLRRLTLQPHLRYLLPFGEKGNLTLITPSPSVADITT